MRNKNQPMVGDRIKIKPTLSDTLKKLKWDDDTIKFAKTLHGKSGYQIEASWTDDDGQEYLTIEGDFDIPSHCCEVL